jgi:F-type H+-transporting ATPase subunit c
VNRIARIALLGLTLLLVASPAWAADGAKPAADGAAPAAAAAGPSADKSLIYLGSAVGAGIVILGGAYGIGRIGSAAVEAMARQPEVAGNIQTAMIIAAALVEGATFFALLICLIKT